MLVKEGPGPYYLIKSMWCISGSVIYVIIDSGIGLSLLWSQTIMNQFWLIFNWTLGSRFQWNYNQSATILRYEWDLKYYFQCIMGLIIMWPRGQFWHCFSNTIQIWWKFYFALTLILMQCLLQNFMHGMTTVLSWHDKNLLWSDGQWLNYSMETFFLNLNCEQAIGGEMDPIITFFIIKDRSDIDLTKMPYIVSCTCWQAVWVTWRKMIVP